MQVFEEAHSILQREGYRDLLPHVTIVRIPPCDQVKYARNPSNREMQKSA